MIMNSKKEETEHARYGDSWKTNYKCLISLSHILFITVIKYIMQNFSSFEKSLEGATSVSYFVQKVNGIFEDQNVPCHFKSFIEHF